MSIELQEALKEALRVVALAIIPLLIDSLSQGAVDLRYVAITALIALLRFVDSYLHETNIAEKGLTRF